MNMKALVLFLIIAMCSSAKREDRDGTKPQDRNFATNSSNIKLSVSKLTFVKTDKLPETFVQEEFELFSSNNFPSRGKKPLHLSTAQKMEIIEDRKREVLVHVSDEHVRSKINQFFEAEKNFVSSKERVTVMTLNPVSQTWEPSEDEDDSPYTVALKGNLCDLGMTAVTTASRHLPLDTLAFLNSVYEKYCEEE